MVEMNNGCICCTLRGDFIEGMQKVLKDVRARGSHLDGVLIETTGLADPSPIASTFFLDPFMQENSRLVVWNMTFYFSREILGMECHHPN